MKKNLVKDTRINFELEKSKYQYKNNKTNDINILLNRVRSNKKKKIKKRLLLSVIFAALLSSVITYLII